MSLKKLIDSFKHETVVLGEIQRHLMMQDEFGADRSSQVIHPSELVKKDFCPRAVYYRLMGWEIPREEHSFQLEVVFEQGHGYHDKWQSWVWDIGRLRGRYRCLACMYGDWSKPDIDLLWYATSPSACPSCGASRQHLQYGEVPIYLPKYRIGGKADGDLVLDDEPDMSKHPLLEIKSIGDGTVRYEAPKLLSKHTKTVSIQGVGDHEPVEKRWLDVQALWRDIRRPFPTHIKQGAVYCLAKERERMVYIYEYKPTGAVKEFEVTHDFEMIADELDACLDLVYAVKKEKIPRCPHGGCAKCEAFEELRYGARDEEAGAEAEPDAGSDSHAGAGEGEGGEEGPAGSAAPSGRSSRARGRRRRGSGVERSGSDGRVRDVHSMGRLLERAARPGGGDRGERGAGVSKGSRREDAPRGRAEGAGDRSQGPRRVVRRRPRG